MMDTRITFPLRSLIFMIVQRKSILFGLACSMRTVLICFGIYQDKTMVVKYTDIDYHVFTDASRLVTQGVSPYGRATYRYTPLLAWILTPNIYLTPAFGKLLFITCDIISGCLMYGMLQRRGLGSEAACHYCALWLLNPLPMGVSTRGNAEAMLSILVLTTLDFLERGHVACAAAFYGLSVHMKIYPVTYALPIALFLQARQPPRTAAPRSTLVKVLEMFLSRDLILFAVVSGGVFSGLTLLFYYRYGWEFLQETYLYHLTRRDIRHNFSAYFYMLYLTAESSWGPLLGLIAFLPQLFLLLLTSLAFYSDLAFCCFLNTAIFVSFNKVCTSQYFLWYLSLLPLVLPRLTLSLKEGLGMLALWFAGQVIWLAPAYYLEFEGYDTFALIWLASLLFLFINTLVLVKMITHYKPEDTTQQEKLD
ncbi:GPI mannosyltransferase 1-like [Scleropages formosus]|uniref:GPI alpha-1,4-mannosyltransferase I, catalytic subunit n=1 Tax=Scleropages formosus TaxID=113540 RepID=A0A0N8JVH2_SCLFO|nr:GPI mannosyltransferase 1 [Scleropages formosus]KPP58129.1 GPI mannosyltransferase 1-like [Scleropages formosus]